MLYSWERDIAQRAKHHGRLSVIYLYMKYEKPLLLNNENCIFVEEIRPNHNKPIYIGQIGDFSECSHDNQRRLYILHNVAIHIHVHESDTSKPIRLAEVNDLIQKWNPIYND